MKHKTDAGFTLLELIFSVMIFFILMIGVSMAMSQIAKAFSNSLEADRAYAALERDIKEETVRGHATGEYIRIEFEIGGKVYEEILHQYRAEKDGCEMEYYK
ncbi:MAG: prepilin-type N-terminal cleavage/methylation domain-containing protein [bacterium]|nr:prepilin-type N-terminal cleavage/methylation domain-containing protein [bacterium]